MAKIKMRGGRIKRYDATLPKIKNQETGEEHYIQNWFRVRYNNAIVPSHRTLLEVRH